MQNHSQKNSRNVAYEAHYWKIAKRLNPAKMLEKCFAQRKAEPQQVLSLSHCETAARKIAETLPLEPTKKKQKDGNLGNHPYTENAYTLLRYTKTRFHAHTQLSRTHRPFHGHTALFTRTPPFSRTQRRFHVHSAVFTYTPFFFAYTPLFSRFFTLFDLDIGPFDPRIRGQMV